MTDQPTLWDDTDQLLDAWRIWQVSQGLSDRTYDERIATMRHLFELTGATPRTLSPFHIIVYCGRTELSDASRWSYHTVIRAFCAWMIKVRIRGDDPTEETPKPKKPRAKPRPLAFGVVRAIYEAANRERTRAYIMLAVLQGLRIHEIAKIRGEDLDLERGTLIVTGKGGATEIMPLHPEVAALALTMPRDGYWFPAYTVEGCIGRKAVYAAIKGAMRRAGYGWATPHQLRHSYATELLATGAPTLVVQGLMRHANVSTTERYADPAWSAKVEAQRALCLAA